MHPSALRLPVLIACVALAAAPALAQTSRPYVPKPRSALPPPHIRTPSPIAKPPPKADYSGQAMRLIQQNLAQQQASQRAAQARGGDGAPLEGLAPPEPPPLPKLPITPEKLALARPVVLAQVAMPTFGDLEHDARLIGFDAQLQPSGGKPDPNEVRAALANAQAPLWPAFLEEATRITAEAYTEEELRVLAAFVTSKEFPAIVAKQGPVNRLTSEPAKRLRAARNRAALAELCRQRGEKSGYCRPLDGGGMFSLLGLQEGDAETPPATPAAP